MVVPFSPIGKSTEKPPVGPAKAVAISALNPDDFPVIAEDMADNMKINSETLLDLVNSTSFSMGYQDARHFLNGLYIEFAKNSITAESFQAFRRETHSTWRGASECLRSRFGSLTGACLSGGCDLRA